MQKLTRKNGWKREYLLGGKPLEDGKYKIEGTNGSTFKTDLKVKKSKKVLQDPYGVTIPIQEIEITNLIDGIYFHRTFDTEDINTLKLKKLN